MITMKIFEDKGTFSHRNKLLYNVIFTGLSVGLGIKFFVSIWCYALSVLWIVCSEIAANAKRSIILQEAFKGAAKILRWRVLAESTHSIRMLDLILSIESLEKVFALGVESLRVDIWMSLACTAWVSPKFLREWAFASCSDDRPAYPICTECLFMTFHDWHLAKPFPRSKLSLFWTSHTDWEHPDSSFWMWYVSCTHKSNIYAKHI